MRFMTKGSRLVAGALLIGAAALPLVGAGMHASSAWADDTTGQTAAEPAASCLTFTEDGTGLQCEAQVPIPMPNGSELVGQTDVSFDTGS